MQELIIALSVTLLYILIGHFGKYFRNMCDVGSHQDIHMHSFASGVLLSALFLKFFGALHSSSLNIINLIIALSVFTIFYGLNHYLFYHQYNIRELHLIRIELKFLRHAFNILHHLVIGSLFGYLVHGQRELIVFAVPFFFVKIVNTIEKHDLQTKNNKFILSIHEWFMSIVTLIGFIVSATMLIPEILFNIGLAFVTGGIFYSIISQIFGRMRVSIFYMIIGEILYALLLLIK